jgi:antitoxin component YwqK of YwqJK toxin-antitoxin module
LPFIGFGQTTTKKEYYENGNLSLEWSWNNKNQMHGTWKVYYKTGQIEYEKNYSNGKLNGKTRLWYRNGQQKSEWNHENDNMHGVFKDWYENGQLSFEENWKNGREHGITKSWYQNGQLEREADYTVGTLNYESCWDEKGEKVYCNRFDGRPMQSPPPD